MECYRLVWLLVETMPQTMRADEKYPILPEFVPVLLLGYVSSPSTRSVVPLNPVPARTIFSACFDLRSDES